ARPSAATGRAPAAVEEAPRPSATAERPRRAAPAPKRPSANVPIADDAPAVEAAPETAVADEATALQGSVSVTPPETVAADVAGDDTSTKES
ncbi:MAG: 2-oxoglutarate dehydrogenase, E2 component, dihydrolipoamide succinyltransferase, partial [Chloroflexota bacterium]|nr:2-oxoglutarate dehydrogenase, E2 component, dihydrolipoamide succinyltransferase [Chloroflexota bacterium]